MFPRRRLEAWLWAQRLGPCALVLWPPMSGTTASGAAAQPQPLVVTASLAALGAASSTLAALGATTQLPAGERPPPAPGGGGGALHAKEVLGSMDSFEAALRNGTRARREREETRVSDLRASIRDVEARVGEEAERHAEAARALQAWAETQVSSVRARLEEQLAARHADTLARVAALNARVDALEAKFERDRAATVELVERRNSELVSALEAFRQAFEAERKARLEREAALLVRLGTAEHEALAQWEAERAEREQVYMAAKARLEEAIEARERGDSKFQQAMVSELAALRAGLGAEAEARAAEDDHLAASLAAYVQKLQASLALVNSEDAQY